MPGLKLQLDVIIESHPRIGNLKDTSWTLGLLHPELARGPREGWRRGRGLRLVALVVELLLRQSGLPVLLGDDLEGLVQAEDVAAPLGLELEPIKTTF